MKKKSLIGFLSIMFFAFGVYADDAVTPRELFTKVGEAVMFIIENGDEGVKAMSEKAADNPFIWKDTYVFVFKCEDKLLAAHPNTNLIGNKGVWNLKDPNGKLIMQTLCEVASANENGGWFDYYWPKEQSKTAKTTAKGLGDKETLARKISFCIQVPGTPYQVAAGIYDDTLSVEELNAKIAEW
ncbi:cache domain-containing protein [bacterium]|nr:cache domain-containing protein [bacterium]